MSTAVLTIALIALLAGLALSYASKSLPPNTNPLVEQVNELLPQTQCAQCGYPGCRPYARAIVDDGEGNTATDDGTATVSYGDSLPSITVAKTPSIGSVPETGGTVTFTVEVANTSDEPITLTTLSDDIFGDLLDGANPAISANGCDDQATAIGVGGTFTCTFDAALSGLAGDPDHQRPLCGPPQEPRRSVVRVSERCTAAH